MGQDAGEREISTTVITAGELAFLPDLGNDPDVELLYALASTLGMYVGFELNTHVRWLGLEPSPVYDPSKRSHKCIGLCKTRREVPVLADNVFDVVNPARE